MKKIFLSLPFILLLLIPTIYAQQEPIIQGFCGTSDNLESSPHPIVCGLIFDLTDKIDVVDAKVTTNTQDIAFLKSLTIPSPEKYPLITNFKLDINHDDLFLIATWDSQSFGSHDKGYYLHITSDDGIHSKHGYDAKLGLTNHSVKQDIFNLKNGSFNIKMLHVDGKILFEHDFELKKPVNNKDAITLDPNQKMTYDGDNRLTITGKINHHNALHQDRVDVYLYQGTVTPENKFGDFYGDSVIKDDGVFKIVITAYHDKFYGDYILVLTYGERTGSFPITILKESK